LRTRRADRAELSGCECRCGDAKKIPPAARTSFIDKIAAPVLNKMFDCGIIQ
jgi:hypothetical protein